MVSLGNTSTKPKSCCPETRAGSPPVRHHRSPQKKDLTEQGHGAQASFRAPGCCFGPRSSRGDEAGGSPSNSAAGDPGDSTAVLQQHQQDPRDGVCAVPTDQQAGSAAGISRHTYLSYRETKCSFRFFFIYFQGKVGNFTQVFLIFVSCLRTVGLHLTHWTTDFASILKIQTENVSCPSLHELEPLPTTRSSP